MAYLFLYLSLSALTFAVYASDKRAAKRDRRRVPETTLHLLALAGGWPGALVAQRTLRHKTRKTAFQVVFWLTVLLNLAAVYAITQWPIAPTPAPPSASSPGSAPTGR